MRGKLMVGKTISFFCFRLKKQRGDVENLPNLTIIWTLGKARK
jgi:hypothetical protein